jgi:cytochrome c-type biogenesis protein CcmH
MNTRGWPVALWAAAVALGCGGPLESAPSARAIEGRLIAPCCWTQTLDVHESEEASSLRGEIRRRLAGGERAEAIEDDLVARYGDRMRAVPKARDPRRYIPLVTGLGMALSATGLIWLLRRWTRRQREAPSPARAAALRDAYDDRLDAELADEDPRS